MVGYCAVWILASGMDYGGWNEDRKMRFDPRFY